MVGFSKVSGQTVTANCIKTGDFIIEANYGFPYFIGTLVTALNNSSSGQGLNLTIHNSNHLGGRFEYVVSKNIGVGLEYTYAAVSIRDNSSTSGLQYSIIKQRALMRLMIHLLESERGDIYGVFGAGYRVFTVKTNDPAFILPSIYNIVPVASRLGFGFRVFITPVIGLHAEIGIGGPLVQGGVSIKF